MLNIQSVVLRGCIGAAAVMFALYSNSTTSANIDDSVRIYGGSTNYLCADIGQCNDGGPGSCPTNADYIIDCNSDGNQPDTCVIQGTSQPCGGTEGCGNVHTGNYNVCG